MNTRRILVSLDGSTMDEAALTVAEDLASRTETTLILVRAADAPDELANIMAARLHATRDAQKYLDTLAIALSARGFDAVETASLYGPAAAVILEAARIHEPDVIVLATSARRGFRPRMFGSVAETVARGTQTPVFVVRAGDTPRWSAHRRAVSRESDRAHV